jgi:hypothetical protein
MKTAPATFLGEQPGFGIHPGFSLYNLTADILGHPAGSTVSDVTLRELGYALPESANIQKVRQRMKDSHNPFGI